MDKPEVGQTIYQLKFNFYNKDKPKLEPVKVVKVGRKYFYCANDINRDKYLWTKYHLEDWTEVTDYTPNTKLYPTEQSYYDENESAKICNKIHKSFNYGYNMLKLPIKTLRKIEKLMEETK